jgi:hypothetical protein
MARAGQNVKTAKQASKSQSAVPVWSLLARSDVDPTLGEPQVSRLAHKFIVLGEAQTKAYNVRKGRLL